MQTYLYARWSSLEQSSGSTLERQVTNCEAFAADRGWTIAETIIDRGRSAYTGANIETGELGKFAARIVAGEFPAVRLVVEELDRLSRQPADVMLSWLSPLVRRGLTIVVTQTGQVIDRAMLDHDMGGLMMLLITAFGSHKESRKKSERVGSAWASKRRKAEAGEDVERNHRHPSWLRVNAAGEFEAVPDRAAIVRRIFDERVTDGRGKALIAKRLNEDRVSTWSHTARKAALWTATYVGRVLNNRAVLGEWQPYSFPRGGKRQPVGEPIAGYYPQIITPEVFARANDKRAEHQRKHQGRGRSLSNLLGTRARCGVCGGQVTALGSSQVMVRKNGSTYRHYQLYCQAAKVGKTCTNQRGWNYDRVEGPLLDHILSLALDDQHFAQRDEAAPIESEIYSLREALSALEGRMTRLLDMLEDGDDAMLERYRQRKLEATELRDRLADAETRLEEAKGKVSPETHVRRVAEVRAMMWSEDSEERFAARTRVKAALGALIERMEFIPATGLVFVTLADKVRAFAITHDGQIKGDMDLVSVFGEEQWPLGPTTITENGRTSVDAATVEQAEAAKAYRRRLAA